MNIYREHILEHYKDPNNLGNLASYNIKCHAHNPSCGDELEIKIKIENKKIKDAKFQGKGCAISLASADILLDDIKNKSLSEIKKLRDNDILTLLGVELTPSSKNCALLPLNALRKIK